MAQLAIEFVTIDDDVDARFIFVRNLNSFLSEKKQTKMTMIKLLPMMKKR